MHESLIDELEASIRAIADYPKPGIVFRDITTLLQNPRAFRRSVDALVHPYVGIGLDQIVGIEARGFIPIQPGEKVLLVDDLIATGGTAEAGVKLLQELGADVVAACFVIDLPDLGGRKKIETLGVPVRTLIEFEGD